jgi:hypothetical protein
MKKTKPAWSRALRALSPTLRAKEAYMGNSFIEYLQAGNFIAPEDAAACRAAVPNEKDQTPDKICHILQTSGIMTGKELEDAMFYYNMDNFLESNTITLPEKNIDGVFFGEYLNITVKGFSDFLHTKAAYGEIAVYSSLQESLVVYQPIKGVDGSTLITGFAGPASNMMEAAAELHKKLSEGFKIPHFQHSKEEMVDFYFELLNNINSACSYKFDMGYDLKLPRYQENTIMTAARIYTAEVSVLQFKIIVFVIFNGDCAFERMEG